MSFDPTYVRPWEQKHVQNAKWDWVRAVEKYYRFKEKIGDLTFTSEENVIELIRLEDEKERAGERWERLVKEAIAEAAKKTELEES